MVAILVLLAPGGLSWLKEASSASRSFTVGVPMVASLLYGPLWMVLRLLHYGLALVGRLTSLQMAHCDY